MIALLTWPQLLADRPWIHCIDNNAVQGAIIKGSSNSLNGDIIGETWNLIRKVRCWLWLDRVASESNPIDGVSRRKWDRDPTILAKHRWSNV